MESNITIKEIINLSDKYNHNIIVETDKILECEGNIIYIGGDTGYNNKDTAIVIGKILNNLYMVRHVVGLLIERPYIKRVIWNKSETFTPDAQNALRNILDELHYVKFIFITNNVSAFHLAVRARCSEIKLGE